LDVSANALYSLPTTQTLSGYGSVTTGSNGLSVYGNITPGSIDGTTRGLITVNGGLTLASTAVTTLTLVSTNGGVGTGYDGVKVTGTLQYSGQLNLIVNDPEVGTFNLFQASKFETGLTGVSLAGSWNPGAFTPGANGSWTYVDNTYDWIFKETTGQLTVALVPEPSTWVLLGIGLVLGVLFRRKLLRKQAADC
jgi:hypothetical protein